MVEIPASEVRIGDYVKFGSRPESVHKKLLPDRQGNIQINDVKLAETDTVVLLATCDDLDFAVAALTFTPDVLDRLTQNDMSRRYGVVNEWHVRICPCCRQKV